MQKTIPNHLISTYQLLQCAFPYGVDEPFYFPLLSILYEQMSDRNLAQVIAEFMERDYYVVLNDVYRVKTTTEFAPETINFVQQKLIGCNYEKWLADE